MTSVDAARYIGVGATTFDEMVKDGHMPRPKQINGCLVWDRVALDAAFTELPGASDEISPANAIAPPDAKPRVFTPRTLAERWRCSEKHVRNMIERQEIPSFKLGRLLRIDKADVEQYENSQISGPPSRSNCQRKHTTK